MQEGSGQGRARQGKREVLQEGGRSYAEEEGSSTRPCESEGEVRRRGGEVKEVSMNTPIHSNKSYYLTAIQYYTNKK